MIELYEEFRDLLIELHDARAEFVILEDVADVKALLAFEWALA